VNTPLPTPGSMQADKFPLPSSLGGFSATIHQTAKNVKFNVPILGVKQTDVCAGGGSGFAPDCVVTSLIVQIPYGLGVHNPLILAPIDDLGVTELVINVNGNPSRSFALGPIFTRIHMLTNCDGSPADNFGGLPCSWLVTHA